MKRKGDAQEKPETKKKKGTNFITIGECQTQTEVERYSCPELKAFLLSNGLSKTGNKPALVARVMNHLCRSPTKFVSVSDSSF